MSTVGSGGSEFSDGGASRLGVPLRRDRDDIGLAGNANAGLRFDVEERLDARRVQEVDRALRDRGSGSLRT